MRSLYSSSGEPTAQLLCSHLNRNCAIWVEAAMRGSMILGVVIACVLVTADYAQARSATADSDGFRNVNTAPAAATTTRQAASQGGVWDTYKIGALDTLQV